MSIADHSLLLLITALLVALCLATFLLLRSQRRRRISVTSVDDPAFVFADADALQHKKT